MTSQVATPAKSLKTNKNDRNKAWLSQMMNEVGEETLLHPKVSSDRHPYTKEVLLIAGLHGYSQEAMGRICGVSQSQISQWIDGQSKASFVQLRSLINKLSPMAPGDSFHFKTIVNKTYFKLPEDWEVKVLQKKLRSDYSRDELRSFALAGVKSEASAALTEVKDMFESNLRKMQGEVRQLEELKVASESELATNKSALEDWDQSCKTYLLDRPELNSISTKDKEALVNRELPKPVGKSEDSSEYKQRLDQLTQLYKFEIIDNEEEIITSIKAQVSSLIVEMESNYDIERKSLVDSWTKEVEKNEIFGKYSNSVDTSIVALDSDTRKTCDISIREHANKLYGDTSHSFIVTDYYREEKVVTVNMAESFVEYCLSLTPSVDTKEVQICGPKLINGQFQSDQMNLLSALEGVKYEIHESEGENNFPYTNGIECYQLFGNRLAVEWTYLDSEMDEITYIAVLESLDDALRKIDHLLSHTALKEKQADRDDSYVGRDKEPLKKEISEYFKSSLIESGYRMDGVQAIY